MKIHLTAHENDSLVARTEYYHILHFHCWTTLINIWAHHYPIKKCATRVPNEYFANYFIPI